MEEPDASSVADYCGVTVVSGGTRMDIALPASVPSGDLLPSLVRLLAASGSRPPVERWELCRVGGAVIPAAETLSAAGVLHGDVLFFRTPEPGGAQGRPTGGSMRDRVEDIVAGHGLIWTADTTARFTAWVASTVGAVLIIPAMGAAGSTLILPSAMAAIVLGLLAVVQARRSFSVAAACLAIGCLWAMVAGWSWLADVPQWLQTGTSAASTPNPSQVPGAIALGAGVAGLLAAASIVGYPAALIHLTIAATVAGSALAVTALSTTRVPLVDISAAAALTAVLAIGVVPRFGLALGGLSATGGEAPSPRLDNRVRRSDRLLIGMIGGLSAVAVLGALPAALSADRWQQLLAGAIGVGLLLRSRIYSQMPHVVGPRTAGVVVLLVLWFGIARAQSLTGGLLFVVPITVLGVGALLAAVLPGMTPVVRARVGRLLNGAELVLVVAAVVLVAGVLGLFDWVGAVTDAA